MRKVEVYYYNSATKYIFFAKIIIRNWLCLMYSFFNEFSFERKREIYMIFRILVPRYVYILFLSLSDYIFVPFI